MTWRCTDGHFGLVQVVEVKGDRQNDPAFRDGFLIGARAGSRRDGGAITGVKVSLALAHADISDLVDRKYPNVLSAQRHLGDLGPGRERD